MDSRCRRLLWGFPSPLFAGTICLLVFSPPVKKELTNSVSSLYIESGPPEGSVGFYISPPVTSVMRGNQTRVGK
jgi:hypothetical protein